MQKCEYTEKKKIGLGFNFPFKIASKYHNNYQEMASNKLNKNTF